MDTTITRRRALTVIGGAGLGAVVAACGGGDSSSSSADTKATASTAPSTTSTTAAAATATGLAALFPSANSCSLTPEETEGPFYFDVNSMRRDIREDRQGQQLRLGVRVLDAGCAPISDAVVDVWHCDAEGSYSGFESASMGGPGAGRTDDEIYLRGTQATDADGIAEFVTVYPGSYTGRTVHIHAKVHLGGSDVLTTQFFFDEDFTARVYAQAPYPGEQDVANEDDDIFDDRLLLTLSEDGEGSLGLITLTVQA